MENEHTLAIRQTLAHSGAFAAEHQLKIIGDNAGDEELGSVIQSLDPWEVAAIVKEGDYTKPSIAAAFITPEQFLNALEHLGSSWGTLNRKLHGWEIESMHNRVSDFVLSTILHLNKEKRQALIDALCLSSLGFDILQMLPLLTSEHARFFEEEKPDIGRAEVGTWLELYVEIEEFDSDSYKQLRREILVLNTAKDMAVKISADPVLQFSSRVLKRMAQLAHTHAGVHEGTIVQEEVFSEI